MSNYDYEAEMVRVPVGTSLADMERAMIVATLKRCAGNKTRTAAMLGVSLKTLYNRLNEYRAAGNGISVERSIGLQGASVQNAP